MIMRSETSHFIFIYLSTVLVSLKIIYTYIVFVSKPAPTSNRGRLQFLCCADVILWNCYQSIYMVFYYNLY